MPRHDPKRLDPTAYPWRVDLETRFGDMDVNFHLNNVAVAGLYEEARVRFNWHLRETFRIGHPHFVIARVEIDYLGEGKYRAPTSMGLAVVAVGTTSWRAAMGLFQSDGGSGLFQPDGCIGLSETVMVHRGDDGGPAPIPPALRTALGEFALRP